MSKSSNAFFGMIVDRGMRNAVPVLFWCAVLMAILAIGIGASEYLIKTENDQTSTGTRYYLFLNVVVQGLTNATWPFVGAAIVWTLQHRRSEAAE